MNNFLFGWLFAQKSKSVLIQWAFGPQIQVRSLIIYALPIQKKVPVAVNFVDAAGNKAEVDGNPVWDTSDPSKITLEVATDGMSAIVSSVGPLGTSQVSVKADAKIGSEVKEIVGLLDIVVVSGEAVGVILNPGEMVDQ